MAKYNPTFTPKELATEEWRAIPVTDDFLVSSLGRIKRVKSKNWWRVGIVLKLSLNSEGYPSVRFSDRKQHTVHSLVALAFHGLRPKDYHIHHRDHSRTNNRKGNLEYISRSDHERQQYREGQKFAAPRYGSEHHHAKFTEEQIKYVLTSNKRNSEISRELGMHPSSVTQIRKRQRWKHVII